MSYPNLQRLRDTNEKAANEIVASIVRGVHAGNRNMTPHAAARMAVETAEEALKLMRNYPLPEDDGGDT